MSFRILFSRLSLVTAGYLVASTACAAVERKVSGAIVDEHGIVAARLYIEGPAGTFHFARSAATTGTSVVYDVKRSETSREQHVTLSADRFDVDLAPGTYTLTAERGHEYLVAKQTIVVPEVGDLPQVELVLKRWVNMAKSDWYSGDTHIHRRLEDMPNLVAAEDLQVAFPLTYWVRNAYDLPAQKPVDRHPAAKLVTIREQRAGALVDRVIWPINTEYELFTVNSKPHTEGAVFVLNHKTPLRAAAPPVGPVTQAARAEGAILDLDKHTWNWSPMIVPIMEVDLFELANNHVWRTEFLFKNWTADVLPKDWEIETDPEGFTERGWIDWGFKTYYAFLNCGFRMRPTGGTGSGVHPVPTGFGRVYVECPGGFTYDKWMAGLNVGRSFVTTGPMLTVTFDDQPPGTVFKDAKPRSVRVKGVMKAASPFQQIEIIVNGKVIPVPRENRTFTPAVNDDHGSESHFSIEIPVEHSAWIAVRCFEHRSREPNPSELLTDKTISGGVKPSGITRTRFAHTAPIHVEIDGPLHPRKREVNYFIQRLEQEITRNTGVLADDEVGEYRKALEIYHKISERVVAD